MNTPEIRESFSFLPTNKLYRSSRFNDINWDVLANHDLQPSVDLFQNLSRFNYINWNIFKIKPDAESLEKSLHALMKIQPTDSILLGCNGQRQIFEKFNDIFKYKLWNYETNIPVEPLFEDEGFSTPGSNFSGELDERHDHIDSEILTSAVNLEIAKHVRFIWEQHGRQWTHREHEFISEHQESVLYLWKIWNVTRLMCHPTPIGLQISFEEFKTDINYLMFGVASNSFYFAPITKTFHVREKLYLPTVTPEAVASFCTKFLECGNNFVALQNFITMKSKIKECGPIYRTFCSCVKNVLQMHRCGLLNIDWKNIHTLSQLENLSSPFRRKISFTKDLCAMEVDDENYDNKLPHGILLLDRLYASLVHIETTDLKFLALYFFESCCSIYLKIVSEWLFNGCFSNPANYDEFFVQIQHELEVCWDWRRLGYVRVNEKQIPLCLRKFFKDIFACGKSVNLLRIFSKKDIFEQILPKTYPSIRCCFNSAQIEAYTLEWRQFQDNFYRKRKWSIKLKDRLIQNYNTNFQNIVKETRRKWFEDFETRQRGTIGDTAHINETTKNGDAEPTMISSSNLDQKIDIAEPVSCTATDFSIIEKRNYANERVSLHTVTESGDGLPEETRSSECTEWHGAKSESTRGVIIASSACRGAGDSETPLKCIPLSSRIQTEYQRNRQNSMSSTTFSQSGAISFPQVDNKFTSTPLSACVQNRIKNMSTTFNSDPVESVNRIVTPMSDCVRNRMNVMRSEYYERLSYTDSAPSERTAGEKPFDESECGKNKLKVMTSEYHIRLNALAKQEVALSSKLSNEKNTGKMTNREMNVEELDQHVGTNTDEDSIVGTVESVINSEDTITNIVSEEENLDGEADSRSENLVTIIENAGDTDLTNEGAPVVQSMIDKISVNPSQYRNIFPKLVTKSTSELLVSARSVKDVDITSVLYYLSPSISIPLRIQSKLANEAILWVFIEQEGYLEHLKTLKNYVLLRKAEFSLSITNSLFEICEDVKSPSLLLNSYTLNSILQRALSACNSENLAKFQRNLSFTLEDPIPDFFNLTDTQMLRCLSMHYTVKWPVNVLITEPIVKKYSRIFRFLIQLQRVSWVLKTDFKFMKNFKRGKSVQFTQVQLFRHTMTQVIRLLKEYVMREALEQCWSDLVHNLTNTEVNLDELYMIHLKYINKIIQRCFLCEDSMICHNAILHIFGSILQYHSALRKGFWHRNEEFNLLYHTNFKNLQAAYQEFCKNLNNFRTLLTTLVYQKQKTYFEPLLLQLNSNIK